MRKLLLFSCAFAAAAVCFCILGIGNTLLFAAVAFAASLLCFFLHRRLKPVGICLLGLCAGLLWCGFYTQWNMRGLSLADGQVHPIEAYVLSRPTATRYGWRVDAAIIPDGREYEGVFIFDEPLALEPGDKIRCEARLSTEPEDSEYLKSNRAEGSWVKALAKSEIVIDASERGKLRFFPARLSCALQDVCKELFDAETVGFMTAITTGFRGKLSFADRIDLSNAGLYHVVAISGMHVSTLVGVILLVFRRRKKYAALFGLPIVLLFVLMSGASPSAIRAGFMQMLLLAAPLVKRENDPPTSLGAALLFLLILNPWSICSVSLQLSFAAVAGILLFAERIQKPISEVPWLRRVRKIPVLGWLCDAMIASFACSVAVSAVSFPLVLYYYRYQTVLFVLSNTLLLWMIEIVFVGGMLTVLLGLISLPAAAIPAAALAVPARLILRAATFFTAIPYASVSVENPYFLIWTLLLYAVLWIMLLAKGVKKLPCIACLAFSFGVCAMLAHFDLHGSAFSFTALDVGQGQCLILQSGTQTVMVDCGGSNPEYAGEDAAKFLRDSGDFRLETLILTHYDIDHSGGVMQLLHRVRTDELYLPDMQDDYGIKEQIAAFAASVGTNVHWVQKQQTLPLPNGMIQIFLPENSGKDDNTGICVLESVEKYDILITGDRDTDGEAQMLRQYPLFPVELLVAGHHGSKYATGQTLLRTVQPQTVIISVGENSYGHPNPETLQRIAASGADVLRTDLCGTVIVRR